MSAAIVVGGLAAAGAYLVLQRGLVRIAIGLVLFAQAINILVVSVRAGHRTTAPIAPFDGPPADPLAHAFVITAIVIGLATTVFLLALALRHARLHGADDDEDGRS